MPMLWREGEWGIHLNETGAKAGGGMCLRHIGCPSDKRYAENYGGQCACGGGVCYHCKAEAPDEVKGFFDLVRWKR